MRYRILLLAAVFSTVVYGQTFQSSNHDLDSAFALAVRTLDKNTHNGIIHAGGGYGGEWTRDCAINSKNAASMLRPASAEKSLWSVTETKDGKLYIGHQYWDKILWVIAAWNHYLWNGDKCFLRKTYDCGSISMQELEDSCYDTTYHMFRGPAVFQDGIEAYDEPIFDPNKWDDSFVLHHPHGRDMMCLSSNLVYAEAYKTLGLMAGELGIKKDKSKWTKKYKHLQKSIKKNLLSEDGKMEYLIDYRGVVHDYQEGLGIGLALLYDLTNNAETQKMMSHVKRSRYGITSVSPCFPRNSAENPGRHNVMVWPHVNALFATGCLHKGYDSLFYDELNDQCDLALKCGKGCFYEIYTVDGVPSGGYQCKALWSEKADQTWCATGFIRNIIGDLCGIEATANGLEIHPIGMKDGSECSLIGIKYRDAEIELHIKGHGRKIAHCTINGKKSKPIIGADAKGLQKVEIFLK